MRGVGGDHVRGRPVLLAADGSMASLAAARLTAALADRHGAIPHAVRALDATPVAIPAGVSALVPFAATPSGHDAGAPDARALREELAGLAGRRVDWPVHLAFGAPAVVITRTARAIGAALIVMGIRRHGPLDRVTHDETTRHVMRDASCPVLGVTPALTVLPRRVVVGVDFSPASMRAASVALDVLDAAGTLVLAYVQTAARAEEARLEDQGVAYALGVEAAFDRLVTDLVAPADVTVERVTLPGDAGDRAADALLAIADERGADLVAVGSHRHDWLDRALLGSVTTHLARDGRHSLLVVPPPRRGRPRPLDVLAR